MLEADNMGSLQHILNLKSENAKRTFMLVIFLFTPILVKYLNFISINLQLLAYE